MKIVTVMLSLVCFSLHAMENNESIVYKVNVSSWKTNNQNTVLQNNDVLFSVSADSLQTALKHHTDVSGGADCIAQVYIESLCNQAYILTFSDQEVWKEFYAAHSGNCYYAHQYKLEQQFNKDLAFMRSLKEKNYTYIKERLSRAPSIKKSEQAKIAAGVITSLCLLYYINRRQQNFYQFLDRLEKLIDVHHEVFVRMLVSRNLINKIQ
jgi:hypothetical protein